MSITKTLSKRQSIVGIQQYERFLTIQWSDGFESSFHYFWLRDNCKAMLCSHSGQREINPAQIPLDVYPKWVKINGEGQLQVQWFHDKHLSNFESDWLRRHSYSNGKSHVIPEITLWDSTFDPGSCTMDYHRLQDDVALRNWVQRFQIYGFARLHNVPTNPKEILEIGKRISRAWTVCPGSYFEVDGHIGSRDYIASTNKLVGLHTDAPYFDPPPPVQALHCLRNETIGGERTLSDGWSVVRKLREENPEYFQLLSLTPIKFCWKAYEYIAPVIQTNGQGEVIQIRYSNQSLQPLQLPMDKMEAYYEAYRCFSQMLTSKDFQIQFKFEPGELNIINNSRVLHGRNAFSTEGVRHLSGCFLARDAMYSHLTTPLSYK